MIKQINRRFLFMAAITTFGLSQGADEKAKPEQKMKDAVTTKIAYVDIGQIITNDPKLLSSASDEWCKLYNDIQKKVEPADKELGEVIAKFQKDRAEIESLQKSGLTSETTLRAKSEELGRKGYEIQMRQQELNKFYEAELAKSHNQIWPKVQKTIKNYRIAHGWDVIESRAPVVDMDDSFDKTKEILAILNKEYTAELKEKEKKATEKKA